ncbi:FAD binding domain-containing protein [Aspergillus carlsbadensis]|nr:FAD binding domain-containing protein [Aspergillus carlsbadensis]
MHQHLQYDTDILIVGAGPVGMLLAYQLDRLGIDCFLAERNLETTKWPKMDLTNCRSMEILRVLGLADDYRAQVDAVGADANFDSIFVTSLAGEGRLLADWKIPSVNEQREYIKTHNDGTQPAEPGQRCSQIIFEAWLKGVVCKKPRVTSKFGWTYVGHIETDNGVMATFIDRIGGSRVVLARYLVGCDGGSSRVRACAGIKMLGGQIPVRFYLVHFRSTELAQKLQFGRFWHAFPVGTGFLIDQDEKDIFTAHYPLPDGMNEKLDPREVVYKMLGGCLGRWEIKIDQVLVHSEWQPSFSVAESYSSEKGRVLLAGDAAHRNPPHGGYGMNSGVVDAIDLGWRLAAVSKGYGGEGLLRAYGEERRPMMIRALQRSHRHVLEHVVLGDIYNQVRESLVGNTAEAEQAHALALVKSYITTSGPETLDRGIELDLRYDHSPFIYPDGTPKVPWVVKSYQPSTRPGSRAPHVFLKDGVTSTYDLFGAEWTLIHFYEEGQDNGVSALTDTAEEMAFPLKYVAIAGEEHVRRIWERDLVLLRPDTHVAWRAGKAPATREEAQHILQVVSGKLPFPGYSKSVTLAMAEEEFLKTAESFTGNSDGDKPGIVGEAGSSFV